MAQIFPIDFDEKLTMAQDDYILFSDSEDGNKIKKAQYKNLKGEPGTPGTPGKDGEDGAAATITVGSTTTGVPGSSASVTNSGTSSAAVFNFTIPQGAKGETGADGKDGTDGKDGADGTSATITVGTTTTLPAGSSATVTNSGTSSAAVLNFGIPKGDAGTGSGDVNGPASSTDGHLAVFDGATGKIIKDGGAIPTGVPSGGTDGQVLSKVSGNIAWANPSGSDIVYATQAEYNALLPGAESDNKHYFIYTESGGGGWQPGVNTVAYYQFDNNLNDSSGNSHNFTMDTGTPTYGTTSGLAKYIHFTQGTYTTNLTIPYTTSAYTINMRLKYDGTNKCFMDVQPGRNSQWWNRCGYVSNTSLYMCAGSGTTVTGLDLTNWINVVVVLNSSTAETYINGVLKNTTSITQAQTTANYFRLNTVGYADSTSVYTNNSCNNYMSELILEGKSWTVTEILDYYNNTKANYGIS